MKLLYICLGTLGGLAPVAYIYVRLWISPNYTGAHFDPILVLRSLAIGLVMVPVFAGVGLIAAAMIHLGIRMLMRYLPLRSHASHDHNNRPDLKTSWVARSFREDREGR